MLSSQTKDNSIIAISLLFIIIWAVFSTLNSAKQSAKRNVANTLVFVFLLIHSLLIVILSIRARPTNLFASLEIPLNEPTDSIRARLFYASQELALPSQLERLIARLNSFDARIAYVRFGHDSLLNCDFCAKQDDYMFYALARPLLEYVREAAVVGIVTIRGTGRERYRYWSLMGLAAAAVLEAYYVLTSSIPLAAEPAVTMIHDNALRARRLLFLIFPLLISLIPPKITHSPLSTLPHLLQLADTAAERLHLTRYMSSARERHPDMRALTSDWGHRRRSEAAQAMDDPALRELSGKLGMDITVENGELRKRAREIVESMKKRLETTS